LTTKINPKDIGTNFEREIAKEISLWLTNNQDNKIVWRTVTSGGWYTTENNKSNNLSIPTQAGDLTVIDPTFSIFSDNLYIELKKRKSVSFWCIFNNEYGKDSLLGIWEDTVDKSKKLEKFPVLIIRQTHSKHILFITNEELKDKIDICNIDYRMSFKTISGNSGYVYNLREDIFKIEPGTFLECIDSVSYGPE